MTTFMLCVATIFSFAFPIGLAIWWLLKKKTGIVPVLTGALTFFVFAMVLEQLLHYVVLVNRDGTATAVSQNVWLYAAYAAFAAGIFEEVGRYVAYKTILKRRDDYDSAFAYGIGHGGIEVILVLGTTYALYSLAALGVNLGAQTNAILSVLPYVTPGLVCVAMLERVFAVILHIGLSLINFKGAREHVKWFFAAVLIHAAVDFPAIFTQVGILPIWVMELWTGIFGIGALWLGLRFKKEDEIKKAAAMITVLPDDVPVEDVDPNEALEETIIERQ